MRQNANAIVMGKVEYEGKPALFADMRIDPKTVPDGLHMYEVRHSDDDWLEPSQITEGVLVNFYGTLLTTEPLDMPTEGIYLEDNPFERADENTIMLADFMEDHKEIINEALKEAEGKEKKETKSLSTLGEDLACHYLKENGIEILECNYECPFGKADIVALEDDTLIFAEVKTRSEGFHGLPEYAATAAKRTNREKIATSYLVQNERPSGKVRFDVIAVQMMGERRCLLRHHRDALNGADERPVEREEKAKKSTRQKEKQPAKKEKAAKASER